MATKLATTYRIYVEKYIYSSNMIKYAFLLFVLFPVSLHADEDSRGCFLYPKVHLHVFNRLPPAESMVVHCASRDTDFGNHSLTVDQQFEFSFCVKPFSTLYFCHIWWQNKDSAFNAYNAKWIDNPCVSADCIWEARSDGVYLSGKFKEAWNNV